MIDVKSAGKGRSRGGVGREAVTASPAKPAPPTLPPAAARMIVLQRSAGNTAVTRLLHRSRADAGSPEQGLETPAGDAETVQMVPERTAGPTDPLHGHRGIDARSAPVATVATRSIQRQYTANSDSVVAKFYDELMRSSVFRQLDAEVTAHQPIHLIRGGGAGFYDHDKHTITIPAGLSASRAREVLLYEMHNARHRGSVKQIEDTFEAPITSLSEQPRYRTAARALAAEWHEWALVAESHLRSQLIDHDLGGEGGSRVLHSYESRYDAPDEGWFDFTAYIDDVRKGHTTKYDFAAGEPGWAGEELLRIVNSTSPEALRITQEEFEGFRSGLRSHIKIDAINPFRNLEIVKQASEAARSASAPAAPEPAERPRRRRGLLGRLLAAVKRRRDR